MRGGETYSEGSKERLRGKIEKGEIRKDSQVIKVRNYDKSNKDMEGQKG